MRIILPVLLVALLAAPAAAGLVEEGRAKMDQNQPEKALETFRKALKANPESLDAACGVAEAQLELDKPDDAISAAQTALDIERGKPLPWLLLAEAYSLKASHLAAAGAAGSQIRLCFADANRFADKALSIDPRIPGAYIVKAEAATGDFRKDDAIAFLRKEAEIDPKGAEAPFRIGRHLFQAKDYEGATASFADAVKRDPTHTQSWKWMGTTWEWREDAEKALAAYAKALVYGPDEYSFKRIQKKAGARRDMLMTKVLAELDARIAAAPKDPDPLYAKGDVLVRMGRRADGIAEIKKAVELDPEGFYPYRTLHALALQGNLQEGMALLEWLFAARPNADVANDLGLTHRDRTRNYKKSLEWYLKASELAPENVDILNDTGLIYQYHMRDNAKAMTYYEKVLDLGRTKHAQQLSWNRPPRGYLDSLENMALIYIEQGKKQEALKLLNELLEFQPDRRVALDLMRRAQG
jgi:tetratricopeptide (TPR) repeat protein